jgi:hypothetical protein
LKADTHRRRITDLISPKILRGDGYSHSLCGKGACVLKPLSSDASFTAINKMRHVKSCLLGSAIVMVGLFGSPLKAANIKVDLLACKDPQDLDPLRRSGTGGCLFIPKSTFVIVEKIPPNGLLCVRPLGATNCLWVYEGQVMNRD